MNDPAANQKQFEEVKQKQSGIGSAAAGFFSKVGGGLGGFTGFGFGAQAEKREKSFTTCLTHMKTFQGKSVIMTGATGGIGSKVAKKLLKAGKAILQRKHQHISNEC